MSDKSWEPGMFWKTFNTFASFATFTTFTTFTLSFTLSRHAKQLLFLCLCSKVTLTLFHFHYFRRFHYFHNFHPLIQSLSTCWTSFVFISMLKTHCLLLKIAMVFFGPHPHHPILTLSHSHPLSLSLFLTLTLFQSLIQSLSTCLTTFVLISMLKSRCL